jgi:uncharacterized protein YbjT (DUF2867 family)
VRIFIAGATGVLGRALIANLAGYELIGLTRRAEKAELLLSLGVEPVIGDACDGDVIRQRVSDAKPEIVVNFLTDLTEGSSEANAEIRREAGPIMVAAAQDAGTRRLAVESVAFPLDGASAEALLSLEFGALKSGLEPLVLRFGRLWGPGTQYDEPPEPPSVPVEDAGRRAADLITAGTPGIHVIA